MLGEEKPSAPRVFVHRRRFGSHDKTSKAAGLHIEEGDDRLVEIGASDVNGPRAPMRPAARKPCGCHRAMHARSLWICSLAVWGIAVVTGCVILQAYAASPGPAIHPLPSWPEGSVIPLDGRRPTLLMFLHPLCPCSSASVDELFELLGRGGDRVAAHVVILRAGSRKVETGPRIDGSLRELPGLATWDDQGGKLARRFGVFTSGHVLLYDPLGRLLFSGGITPARGHRGENFGRSAVLAELLGEPADRCSAPAFGCPLFDPQPEPAEARP